MPAFATAKLVASNAVKEALTQLLPRFERMSGHKVLASWGGTLDICARVAAGETFDIVILGAERIEELIASGHLASGSRLDIARSGIAAAVPAGTPRPDISSAAALQATLLAAQSIVLSSGPSSVYLAALFRQMGIADAIRSKVRQIGPGLAVAAALARREGEIGFTQASELLHADGIDYLGELSPDVQHVTVWSAALHVAAPQPQAAGALLAFLTAPEAAAEFARCGMQAA
jgi:molybdate transport system substrate-binding protein